MKVILQLVAVVLLFAIAHGLRCYECKIGLWNLCFTTEVDCAAGEQCYSTTARAVDFVDFSMKGCVTTNYCNDSQIYDFPPKSNNTIVSFTTACCPSNLCNAAPGLPGASGMGLVLATIIALLMTQVMV